MAGSKLKANDYQAFISTLVHIYEKNVEDLQENIDWFVRKFDYRFKDEPWGNAKSSIPRSLALLASIKQ